MLFLNELIESFTRGEIYIYMLEFSVHKRDIQAGERDCSLTIRHIGSIRWLRDVCAGGRRETAHAQIWEQQGTGMSRGRWDVDKRRVSIREKRRVFIWNGP